MCSSDSACCVIVAAGGRAEPLWICSLPPSGSAARMLYVTLTGIDRAKGLYRIPFQQCDVKNLC